MRLVYDRQEIFRGNKKGAYAAVGQGFARQSGGIILNTACVAKLADEREVVKRSALQSLMLKRLLFSLNFANCSSSSNFDVFYRTVSCSFSLVTKCLAGKTKIDFGSEIFVRETGSSFSTFAIFSPVKTMRYITRSFTGISSSELPIARNCPGFKSAFVRSK